MVVGGEAWGFTVSGDALKYTNAAASGGGRADLVWTRIK